jgi:hypothetical protein
VVTGPDADKIAKQIHRNTKPELRPFRFRYQLAPLGWAGLAASGLVITWSVAAVAGLVAAGITVAATRHRGAFARRHCQAMAAWAACWMFVLSVAGPGPWLAAGLLGWAIPSAFWLHHYRWRPATSEAARERTVEEKWALLAERMKWAAGLKVIGAIEGGEQWEIVCNGAVTHIGKILTARDDIAAAFHAAITEAYAEPHRDGRRHHGLLTILREGTLEKVREWDGGTIDPETGLAVIGRFPDGKPVHERYLGLPEDGVKHTIIAGADGSGKTATINLGLSISATSGLIAPVILDPQMGQALPDWRDFVPYACGVDECMTWLRGLHAGMFARSEMLANIAWTDAKGRPRRGFRFFNPYMLAKLGLDVPIIEITIDEAPILLAVKGASALILDIAKLGRKAGFRLRLAAQVPSLAELKAGELRSILNGGNVICHRTGDKVSSGMLNIPANPHELPKQFADGSLTYGLGFAGGPDARPSVTMRSDWVPDPYDVAATTPVRQPDELVWERVQHAVAAAGQVLHELREAADVQKLHELEILAALQRPMGLGELISTVDGMTVSQVAEEVGRLRDAGKIRGDELLEAVT